MSAFVIGRIGNCRTMRLSRKIGKVEQKQSIMKLAALWGEWRLWTVRYWALKFVAAASLYHPSAFDNHILHDIGDVQSPAMDRTPSFSLIAFWPITICFFLLFMTFRLMLKILWTMVDSKMWEFILLVSLTLGNLRCLTV